MKRLSIAALVLALLPLPACGGSNLVVEQPSPPSLKVHSVQLEYDDSVRGVPANAARYLQDRMDHVFFTREPAFGRGQDIILRYRFRGSGRGTQLAQVVLGTKTVLEAEILDREGNVLSRMRTQRDIGLLGVPSFMAINDAVDEIRRYALTHFRG
jgi:hypothetical protein